MRVNLGDLPRSVRNRSEDDPIRIGPAIKRDTQRRRHRNDVRDHLGLGNAQPYRVTPKPRIRGVESSPCDQVEAYDPCVSIPVLAT